MTRNKQKDFMAEGEKYLLQYKWQRAAEQFRKAIEENPFNLKAHERYRDVEYSFLGHKEKMEKYYRGLVEKYPDEAIFAYLLGRVTKWDAPESQELLHRAIALDSTFWPPNGVLIRQLIFRQKLDEAQKFLRNATGRFGHYIDILMAWAAYYQKVGEQEKLVDTYQRLVRQFPDSSQVVWVWRSLARYTDDPQEKITYLERALENEGSDKTPFVYIHLLRLYESYDATKVVPLARKAMAVSPPLRDRRVPSMGYSFLFDYYLKRDTLKAVSLARELLVSKNIDADVHTRIANELTMRDLELPLAIKLLKKAVKLNTPENAIGIRVFTAGLPDRPTLVKISAQTDAYILSSLGWAYYKSGRYKKAVKILRSATGKADWAEAKIYYRLGQAFEKLEKWQKATEAYVKSLSFKEDPNVREAIESLGKRMSNLDVVIPEKRKVDIDSLIAASQMHDAVRAPHFELNDLNGRKISLADFSGKAIVIDFWATWCGPCKAELPHFQKLVDSFKENEQVVFLAISTDMAPQVVQRFVLENGYTFPVLMDKGVAKAYGVRGIPTLFVIDKEGFIRYKHIGFNSNVDFEEMLTREINLVLKM